MDNQPVIKAAIRNVVSKGIRDIRRDPNRSIRRLVDLGIQFGRGRYQHTFFTDAQSALKKKQSAYYDLVTSLIRNVEPKTLETLGFNVGYMSWTQGAKTIRAYEKERGVNVPWTILLDFNRPTDSPIDLNQLVNEGEKLGITAYFLFVGKQTTDLDTLLSAAEAHGSSAFFLFSVDEETNEILARSDALFSNTLLVPRGSQTVLPAAGALLSEKKRMFGLNCEYNEVNAAAYLSDAFLQSVVREGYPFLFLLPAPGCEPAVRAYVYDQIVEIRSRGRYPLFPVELINDVQQVDHIISNESCMLVLSSDGSLVYPANTGTERFGILSLATLIEQAMPRVRHHR